ncbi:MAG: YceI family protein [Euzebyales bacterium]|nr:YceI family protein [Euzebyales bacterium]
MTATDLARTVAGREVPAAGTYVIDPAHSSIEALARHLVFSKVRGRFSRFGGEIVVAEDVEVSSVTVEIDAASVDSREEQRDAHLRSGDFLDVERWPTLRFSSTSVQRRDDGGWTVTGDLTIRDVTRSVDLVVDYLGSGPDPWGNVKAAFSATTQLDREAFGITWNQALETGGVLVGKTLKVELEIQASRQAE